ncbi:MAG: diguanylate cyclase, partial [Phormidesmis sp. RL_2_1]|nr:diguanylate cyclase [Phormidesmis sp. RL_2_1]
SQRYGLGPEHTNPLTETDTLPSNVADHPLPAHPLPAHPLPAHPLPAHALASHTADSLWINWPAATDQAPYYSSLDVLTGNIPADALTGKIVLVGTTATGLDQSLITPFNRNAPASNVYLHAAVINNLLQQNFLQIPKDYWQWVILCLGGPGLGCLLSNYRRRIQFIGGAGVAIGWVLTSLTMFHFNYWLPTVWPIGLVGITIGGLVLEKQRYEEQQLTDKLSELKTQYGNLPLLQNIPNIEEQTTQQPPSALQMASYLTEMTAQVSQLVWQDDLTQVGNRRDFERGLALAWQQAISSQQAIAILICDVDLFKDFNDTYGTDAGDRCLQQVASTIRTLVSRPGDLVTRYSGESFALVLPNTKVAGAIHVGQQICGQVKALAIPHAASPVNDYVSMSVGVAVACPHQDSLPQVLVEVANQALQRAKALGRDRAFFKVHPLAIAPIIIPFRHSQILLVGRQAAAPIAPPPPKKKDDHSSA